MNQNYVSGKIKQKGKNKQTNKTEKENNKKKNPWMPFFIRQLDSVFKKIVKSIICLLFSYQTGYIM